MHVCVMEDEAAELLKVVEKGSRFGSIQLEDVEKILSNEHFVVGGMMATTVNGAVSC